jgi:thymidylate synthase
MGLTEKSFEIGRQVDIVGYNDAFVEDPQYLDLLASIRRNGKMLDTQLEDPAWTLFAPGQLRYDLRNGFPLLTERDLSMASNSAIAEITAFINGVRTLDELKAWGCGWWKNFITEEKCDKRGLEHGDFGPGSYGAAFHDFPTPLGVGFNQIQAVVDQITANPQLRTHCATSWVPNTNFRAPGYDNKVVWTPCHGSFLHFRVEGDELSLHHVQRSADAPVGLVFNIIQYAALLMVVAKVTGYRPSEYIHTLSDVHIYKRQSDDVETLLSRPPRPFPRALINSSLNDVFAWRKGDVTFVDYNPHEKMLIDTPTS